MGVPLSKSARLFEIPNTHSISKLSKDEPKIGGAGGQGATKESESDKKRLARRWWFAQTFTNRRFMASLGLTLLYFVVIIYISTSDLWFAVVVVGILIYILAPLVYLARRSKYSKSLILYGAQRCLEVEDEEAWERFSTHWWMLKRYLLRKLKMGDLFFLRSIEEDESIIFDEQPENLEQLFSAIGFDIHDRLIKGDTSVLSNYVERFGPVLSDKRLAPAMSKLLAEFFRHVPRWYRITVRRRKPVGLRPFLRENRVLIEFILGIIGATSPVIVFVLTFILTHQP